MNTTIPLGNNPEHTQLGGRRKKQNGHKDNCKCPICINMKYAKRSKKKRGGENENDEYGEITGGRRKSRKHKHRHSYTRHSKKKRGGDNDEEEKEEEDDDNNSDSNDDSDNNSEPGNMSLEDLLEILQEDYETTAKDLLEAFIHESSLHFFPEDNNETNARIERVSELTENIKAELLDYNNNTESGSESEGGRRRKSRKRRRGKNKSRRKHR